MSVSLVAGTGFQYGVELDETGINIESFSINYKPEYKAKLQNKDGQTRTFAVPDKMSREVTIRGEVSGTTGLMAAALVCSTAIVLANDVADYTAVLGGFYVDSATVGQSRNGWRSLDMTLSSDPLVT